LQKTVQTAQAAETVRTVCIKKRTWNIRVLFLIHTLFTAPYFFFFAFALTFGFAAFFAFAFAMLPPFSTASWFSNTYNESGLLFRQL
jgi:hypothetical protein